MALKVLFVAAEAAPFVKTGGLADVMGALPQEMQKLGIEPALVLPKYPAVEQNYGKELKTVYTGRINLAWRNQYIGVEKLLLNGLPVYFIDNEFYF